MRNNVNNYNANDDGKIGKAFECSITKKDKAKTSGRVDWTHLKTRFEIKSGAGELGDYGKRLLKGVKRVIYVPVPVTDCVGTIWADEQEGFVMSRENFLQALSNAGLIREKVSTAGVKKVTIQTFWNRSKNAPHSRKAYNRLLDELYALCDETLEEMIERERAK